MVNTTGDEIHLINKNKQSYGSDLCENGIRDIVCKRFVELRGYTTERLNIGTGLKGKPRPYKQVWLLDGTDASSVFGCPTEAFCLYNAISDVTMPLFQELFRAMPSLNPHKNPSTRFSQRF